MSIYFTDTDCELWYTDADELDIKIIEMPYTLDGEEIFYDMGRNTDFKHLFRRMREGSVPITSALNPQIYMDYFEPWLEKGEDIIYVHFSDKLSGTFKYIETALNILREKYPARTVTLFNTKSICWGAGSQALEGAKLHKAGATDEEIVAFLKDFTKHTVCTFVVDSLAHLKRGGRISATTAVVGGLLNIKPILRIDDEGFIQKYGTAKGMKRALLNMADECGVNYIKGQHYPVYICDADNEEMGDFLEKALRARIGEDADIKRYPIGPVIGAHCGPGTVGLIYQGEKRI